MDDFKTGFTYAEFKNMSVSPESNNALFYIITLKHPVGNDYKKIIATSAFSNDVYVNTKNNGNWLGWEKK